MTIQIREIADVRIKPSTKDRLYHFKGREMTYDEVINRLIDEIEGIHEQKKATV